MKITKLNPALCPIACAEIIRRASFRADGKCTYSGGAYMVENGEPVTPLMKTPAEIIIATLEQVNAAYNGGKNNALTATRGGEVNPEAAYLELVRELLALTK